jgi:diaminobutyrate-2-oxoglutarate transaminase
LSRLARQFGQTGFSVRGHGMVWALDFKRPGSASVISAWALERGLIVEPTRLRDEVLLLMPPLTIDEAHLLDGLERLRTVLSSFLNPARRPRNFTQTPSISHKS